MYHICYVEIALEVMYQAHLVLYFLCNVKRKQAYCSVSLTDCVFEITVHEFGCPCAGTEHSWEFSSY